MREQGWSSRQFIAPLWVTSLLAGALFLFLFEVVSAVPAAAQEPAASLSVVSTLRRNPWTVAGAEWLAVSVLIVLIPAITRQYGWFRQYLGLGVFVNWVSGVYLGSMALLPGLLYSVGSSLTSLPADWERMLSSAGGGGVSHLLTWLGRFIKLGPSLARSPADVDELRGKGQKRNQVFQSIHDEIWEHIRERLHQEVKRMASIYKWETIRDECVALVEEQTLGSLSQTEGEAVIKEIKSLSVASAKEEFESKSRALRLTIANTSFRAIRKRLNEASAGQ